MPERTVVHHYCEWVGLLLGLAWGLELHKIIVEIAHYRRNHFSIVDCCLIEVFEIVIRIGLEAREEKAAETQDERKRGTHFNKFQNT